MGATDIGKEKKSVEICEELLKHYREEGDQFLLNIVTRDELWIHHFDPEEKRQHGIQAHFISSPEKIQNSAVCRQDSFDCFLGLTKSLHDSIFESWEDCQFSSVHWNNKKPTAEGVSS